MLNAFMSGICFALAATFIFGAWVYSLLATTHSRWFACFGVVFAVIACLFAIPAARAQDHSEGHAQYHDVYKDWCQPGNPKPCARPNSCCDERVTNPETGERKGDCFPTEAEMRPSADPLIKYLVWWAKRETGEWAEIPDSKIIHEINPDPTGSRAHFCEHPVTGMIFCFVPPTGGS